MRSEDGPLVLGVDAATPPASVALVQGDHVLARATGPFGRGTDAWIIGAVDRVLEEAGCPLTGVTAFAGTVGPGTFTGIRVGLATAVGLGRGLGRPVAGIGTLEALVAGARRSGVRGPVLAILDARRGRLYAGLAPGDSARPAAEPEVLTADELRSRAAETPEARIVGTAGRLVPDLAVVSPPIDVLPVAAGAALATVGRLREGGPASLPAPRPAYFRPPDAVPGISPLRRRRSRG